MVVERRNSFFVEQPEGEPRCAHIDGEQFPPLFKPESVRSAKALKVYPDDTFVVSYPKCGTTLVQHIVCQLMIEDYQPGPGKELFKYAPMIELVGDALVNRLPRPRVLKTHFNYRNLPKSENVKCILVCRNPKDALVSYYHLIQNIKGYNWENGDFDVLFDMFCEGRIPWGSYFDHLKSWLPHFKDPNVLVLKFEDLVSDLKNSIVKIGDFLGTEGVSNNSERLQEIHMNSTFESMKEDQSKWFPNVLRNTNTFIRKGVTRDWKNYFTEEQSDRIDHLFEKHFRDTVVADWWIDEMKWE